MGFADFVTASVVLAGAVFLLYRSIWKKGGSCHGCSNGACRSPQRESAELVRLGQLRRPSAQTSTTAPGQLTDASGGGCGR
jgi:hypothetical protein